MRELHRSSQAWLSLQQPTLCQALSDLFRLKRWMLDTCFLRTYWNMWFVREGFRFAWSSLILDSMDLETFWVKHLLKKGIYVALLMCDPCALFRTQMSNPRISWYPHVLCLTNLEPKTDTSGRSLSYGRRTARGRRFFEVFEVFVMVA